MSVDVLIIENDAEQMTLMKGVILSLGLNPLGLTSGQQGVQKALEIRPRLIITDIHLGDTTGFELCRQIRGRDELKDIPILMVTGTYTKDEDKLKLIQDAGADAYLRKPFRLPELIQTVSHLIRKDP